MGLSIHTPTLFIAPAATSHTGGKMNSRAKTSTEYLSISGRVLVSALPMSISPPRPPLIMSLTATATSAKTNRTAARSRDRRYDSNVGLPHSTHAPQWAGPNPYPNVSSVSVMSMNAASMKPVQLLTMLASVPAMRGSIIMIAMVGNPARTGTGRGRAADRGARGRSGLHCIRTAGGTFLGWRVGPPLCAAVMRFGHGREARGGGGGRGSPSNNP